MKLSQTKNDISLEEENNMKKLFTYSTFTGFTAIINGGLGALFYIFLARTLGPADFGIITLSVLVLTLIADIADLGTNTGLVKFVSSHYKYDRKQALQFLKLGLEIKFITWLFVLFGGYLAIPFIAEVVLNQKDLISYLRLSLIGVGGALLFTFITSSLQSLQRFHSWGFILILTNLARLIIIILVSLTYILTPFDALITYISIPFLGFLIGLFLLPTREIIISKDEFSLINRFFSYNRWVALTIFITAFSSRIESFIVARFLPISDVGIYNSANQLVAIIPQIVSALGIVIAPQIAAMTDEKTMFQFYKRIQLMVIIGALFGLIGIPLSYVIIPLIYGYTYMEAIPIFSILLMAQLLFLIALPIHTSILYFYSRSDFFVWISILHLVLVSVGSYVGLTYIGLIGVALSVLFAMVINVMISFIWLSRKIYLKGL